MSTQRPRNALPGPPQQGPGRRFLRSEGSPRPQRKSTGAGPKPRAQVGCAAPVLPPRRPGTRGQRPAAGEARGCAARFRAPPHPPRQLRARLPGAPPSRPRGRAPSPLTLGSSGGETFPGERRPRLLGSPRPSAEPGGGGLARAVPAPGSGVTARRRGGAAARPRPGRRPGQGSAWARARAGAAARPRRRGLFTRAAVTAAAAAAAPAPPPPPRRAPPPRGATSALGGRRRPGPLAARAGRAFRAPHAAGPAAFRAPWLRLPAGRVGARPLRPRRARLSAPRTPRQAVSETPAGWRGKGPGVVGSPGWPCLPRGPGSRALSLGDSPRKRPGMADLGQLHSLTGRTSRRRQGSPRASC